MTASILAFLAYFIHQVIADGCKNMDFTITVEGKALVNHTFLTDRATDDAHCQTKCFMDDRCISFNFGRSVTGERNVCELNEADHAMYPDDLVPRSNTIYRMAENECNCTKYEICLPDFTNYSFKCKCKPVKAYEVKLCKDFTDNNNEWIVDASWTTHQPCRVLVNNSICASSREYRLTVSMYSRRTDGSIVMHPGIGFNVIDSDNFEYVYFRPHSRASCIQPGNINKGVPSSFGKSCDINPPPGYAWFQVMLEVRHSTVKVFVQGQFVEELPTVFPPRQKSAFFVYGGYKNIVHFKDLLIEDL